jgi:Icc protein
VDDQPPGFRWLQLHADGRIETAVMRIDAYRGDVDLECGGYR